MNRMRARWLLALSLLSSAGAADAVTPAGPAQWLADIGDDTVIDAATAPDGQLALLLAACDGGQCALEVQRYSADGAAVGGRIAVESLQGDSVPKGYASVALDAAGQVVVGVPDRTRGHVVCFAPDGSRTQHAIRGGYAEGTFVQDLVFVGDGDFVVGFTQDAVPERVYHFYAARMRRFDAGTCAPVAAAQSLERHWEVVGPTLSSIRDLTLSASPDGRLAVAWVVRNRQGATNLKLKLFQANGTAIGGTKVVGPIAAGTAGDVGIAADGQVAVAYHPPGASAPGKLVVRRYSALGVAAVPEAFDVAELPGDANAQVGVSAAGDTVAGWTSFPEAADSTVSVRAFDATSQLLGEPVAVTSGAGHFVLDDVLQRFDGGFTVLYVEFFADALAPRYHVRRFLAD
ncbi:MAG TPA: hypothetical protein VJM11_08085 [Nevskiaceae bacterium]|nr:hypothetical protein [Nevskiaceae bacterium]